MGGSLMDKPLTVTAERSSNAEKRAQLMMASVTLQQLYEAKEALLEDSEPLRWCNALGHLFRAEHEIALMIGALAVQLKAGQSDDPEF